MVFSKSFCPFCKKVIMLACLIFLFWDFCTIPIILVATLPNLCKHFLGFFGLLGYLYERTCVRAIERQRWQPLAKNWHVKRSSFERSSEGGTNFRDSYKICIWLLVVLFVQDYFCPSTHDYALSTVEGAIGSQLFLASQHEVQTNEFCCKLQVKHYYVQLMPAGGTPAVLSSVAFTCCKIDFLYWTAFSRCTMFAHYCWVVRSRRNYFPIAIGFKTRLKFHSNLTLS